MVRFNDKPQIENSALSDTDIMPITDLEDSASDKKISIGQLKEYLSENLTNFADINLVNTDMLADAIIEAPNGVIVANSSNNAIIAKQGLKLLFANGRKANNKFNNLEYTLQSDISQSVVSMANGNYVVFLTSAGSLGYIPITEIYISSEQPQVSTPNAYWYDVISNYWKRTSTSGATWVNTIINILGQVTITNNLLTTVTPNTLAYIPIPETLTIRDLSNITTAGEKRIKDLVQPNINTTVNNASNTINARIDSVNSNLQTQISKNRADINTLDVGGAIEKTPSKLKTALLLSTIMDKPISDVDIFNILMDKKRSTFDRSKFTVVGSPTISDDGIITWSSNNYITTQNKFDTIANLKDKSWKISFRWINSDKNIEGSTYSPQFKITEGWDLWSSVSIFNYGKRVTFHGLFGDDNEHSGEIFMDAPTMSVIPDYLDISLIFNYTLGKYTLDVKPNNGNLVTKDYTPVVANKQLYYLNTLSSSYMFVGSNPDASGKVDLKQLSITVDGQEVFNGNKTGVDQIKADNFTKVGSPVISYNGIASGFSNLNYLRVNNPTVDTTKPWEIRTRFITPASTQSYTKGLFQLAGGDASWNYFHFNTDNKLAFAGKNTAGDTFALSTDVLELGVEYDSITGWDGTQYYIKYKKRQDNTPYIEKTYSSSVALDTDDSTKYIKIGLILGYPDDRFAWVTSIDLNSFKIYVDGNLVYQPTLYIPYTQSKTGEKIVDATYRDRVQDMYEQFGYTHYYTIGDEPEKYNVQVVGNPTLVGGVASGFSYDNYIKITQKYNIINKAIIRMKINTNLSNTESFIQIKNQSNDSNIFICYPKPYLECWGACTGNWGSNILQYNTDYIIELIFDKTNSKAILNIFDNNYVQIATSNDQVYDFSNIDTFYISGLARISGNGYNGSIDLSQFSIEVDGKEVFRGYEPKVVDAYTLATHKNGDIIETFSDNAGTYYEVRADLVQRCVGIIPPQTTQVNYPRAFKEDKNIVQVSYFDVGDSTSTLTLDHIAPKTQTKAGFTIGSTQTANRNYYAEGKAILG